MKIKITTKQWQLLLIGFWLGVITALVVIRFWETQIETAPQAPGELEITSEEALEVLGDTLGSVDRADLESY